MSRLRAVCWIIATAFRCDPTRASGCVVLEFVKQVGGIVIILLLSGALAALAAGRIAQAQVLAAGFAGGVLAVFVCGAAGAKLRMTVQEKAGFEVESQLCALVAAAPDSAYLHDPEIADRIAQVSGQRHWLGRAFSALVVNLGLIAQVVVAALVVAAADVWFLALVAAMVIPAVATYWAQANKVRAEGSCARDERVSSRLLTLATTAQRLPEHLATPCVGSRLRNDYSASRKRIQRVRSRAAATAASAALAGWAAFAAITAGVLTFRSLSLSGSEILVVLLVLSSLRASAATVGGMLTWLQRTLRIVGLADDLRRSLGTSEQHHNAQPASDDHSAIELADVSFRYPGTERWALRDISVRLERGQGLVVVGPNGAGKSTFVNLLLGLYPSTCGVVHGLDGSKSAVLQNFARFGLRLCEDVCLSQVERMDDRKGARWALLTAGATEVLARAGDRLDVSLGEELPLSDGEWQQVAIARGLFAESPRLLVLDEPTAHLDPERAVALGRRYLAVARARAAAGATTVLVSHTLAHAGEADLILVFHEGRIVQQGTHDALVARDGLYAMLYHAQAASYR